MVTLSPQVRKDESLKRKLWLKIAEHLIKKEKDIEKLVISKSRTKCIIAYSVCRAMQFLKECDILKIEDILPFFEDVVTIDQFKVTTTYT